MSTAQAPLEFGLLEAAAGMLREVRAQTPGALDRLTDQLPTFVDAAGRSPSEIGLVLVAFASEFAHQGVAAMNQSLWARDRYEASLRFFDYLGLGAADRNAGGLQQLITGLGPSLAAVPGVDLQERVARVVQLTAAVASLKDDAAAVSQLFERGAYASWTADAHAEVLVACVRLSPRLPLEQLRPVLGRARTVLSSDELDDQVRQRLIDGIDALAAEPDSGTPVFNPSVQRLIEVFGSLFASGDSAGAAIIAGQLAELPDDAGRIGSALVTLADLQSGAFDDPAVAEANLRAMSTIARLPESVAFDERYPFASTAGLLREVIGNRIAGATLVGYAQAAAGLEIVADTRITRIDAARPATELSEVLAMRAVTDRTRSVHDAEPIDLFDIARLRPARRPVVRHVGELVLHDGAGIVASTAADVRTGQVDARLAALAGADLRTVRRLEHRPDATEQLTGREIERLRRSLLGEDEEFGDSVIVASPRLWTLPLELLAPEAEVALSLRSWLASPPPRPLATVPHICHVVDPAMPGAAGELETLRRLDADGAITLTEADSFPRAHAALTEATDLDILVLSVHGAGAGWGHAFRIGDQALPIHQFMRWPLPPAVLAASCHSGTTGDQLSLASLLAGRAGHALVSLWSVNDHRVGDLMRQFYEHLATGATIGRAWQALSAQKYVAGLRMLTSGAPTITS